MKTDSADNLSELDDTFDEELPVLHDVVESGNESIIQSSRLGLEVKRELNVLQQSSPVQFKLQDHLLKQEFTDTQRKERQLDLSIDDSTANNALYIDGEDEIELMIDEIVDRHITELRKDIRRLLLRAKNKEES